jgi:uncharacterized protein (TIGR03437 family)
MPIQRLVFVLALFATVSIVAAQSADPVWVPGSSQKVCQLVGELDHETGQPTLSRTETNYGLIGNDLGSSFEHNGKLWFLFGDTHPTATFNGKPNLQNDAPRLASDNDSAGFTSGTNIDQCLKLDFVRDSIGAYQNPVVLDAQGKPAITLGIDEVPIAGIDVGGRMFVVFGTDNNVLMPTLGNLGFSTRSVVAVSDDDGNTYHYLYDLSAPTCPRCEGDKFVNVAIANGTDGYLYFWGSQGGMGYRNSSVFLARKLATGIAQAGGMQYFTGLAKNGTPNFSAAEADAAALFQDYTGDSNTPANCTGELGVEYNQFVQRWVMLYNCLDKTLATLNGIYMRFATQPWGPWGAPQTIFNGQRDRGFCFFIHRAVTATSPACDQVGDAGRDDVGGGAYGPYFLSRFTAGDAAHGTSTFYYTLSTWNPYVQVIMKTTIQNANQTAPTIGLVANAEGEAATIAPNTWVEIKGSNLAPPGHTRIWQDSDFPNNQMPKQLDNVSATVNGKAAYVYYISPTQVNILTPPDAMSGPVQVLVNNGGAPSTSFTAQAQAVSPSFFVFGGGPYVAATHANGTFLGPVSLYPGSTTPAKPGETVVLYANGFGTTSTPVVSGAMTQSGTLSPLPVIKIGGIGAMVTFAGLNVTPGEFQFNVVVPPNAPDGDSSITATYNGLTTQSGTLIAIQH